MGQPVPLPGGSPFPPLQHKGKTLYPAQANNAYVFPALGHAAVLAGAREMSDNMFLAAAEVGLYKLHAVAPELERAWFQLVSL
jgi:malic enzyme